MKKKYVSQLKQFGSKIKELRSSGGLTQQELAQIAGIDNRTLQRIESAEIGAGLSIVFALAQALKVEPDELLHGIKLPLK